MIEESRALDDGIGAAVSNEHCGRVLGTYWRVRSLDARNGRKKAMPRAEARENDVMVCLDSKSSSAVAIHCIKSTPLPPEIA